MRLFLKMCEELSGFKDVCAHCRKDQLNEISAKSSGVNFIQNELSEATTLCQRLTIASSSSIEWPFDGPVASRAKHYILTLANLSQTLVEIDFRTRFLFSFFYFYFYFSVEGKKRKDKKKPKEDCLYVYQNVTE